MQSLKGSLNMQSFLWSFAKDKGLLGLINTRLIIPKGSFIVACGIEILENVTSANGTPNFKIGSVTNPELFVDFGSTIKNAGALDPSMNGIVTARNTGFIEKEALGELTQAGVAPPSDALVKNEIGKFTYTYNAVGDYNINCPNGFTNNCWKIIGEDSHGGNFFSFQIIDASNIRILSRDTAGALTDGIMTNTPFHIRTFNPTNNTDYISDGTEVMLTLYNGSTADPITAGKVKFHIQYIQCLVS